MVTLWREEGVRKWFTNGRDMEVARLEGWKNDNDKISEVENNVKIRSNQNFAPAMDFKSQTIG